MSLQRLRPFYLGGLLLVCLVLGGGTQKGLPTVFALQLLALPLAFDLAVRRPERPTWQWPVYLMAGLIGLCLAIQFIPILSPDLAFLTRDPGRTLDSMLYVCFALTLFFAFGRLEPAERSRMVAWLLTGVILNVALALTQFAASRGFAIELFPYSLGGGFFSNVNHFSSLLYVAIPFIIYQFDAIDRLPWAALVLAFIVFVEFAAGSRAGIFLSMGCALVSLAVIGRLGVLVRIVLIGIAAVGTGVLASNPGNVLGIAPDDPLDRPQIALTTLAAISKTLPLGSGYGTFDIVYPSVETDVAVSGYFINHAHNEPLELLLEGGLPAAAAILAYLGLLVWRLPVARQSPLALAALCGIGFTLIHSLVDYPLRTAALVAVFALLNAIYLAPDQLSSPARQRRNGRTVGATSSPTMPAGRPFNFPPAVKSGLSIDRPIFDEHGQARVDRSSRRKRTGEWS